ncbi:MAG: DUF2442 domain-containing protein [Chloroflexi bacterium]|nr:DUF2442 domain-containing protein [Chloroflexota bacterium]
MGTPKIKSVIPLDGKRLRVTFINGIQKIYDCRQILHREIFQVLNQDAFFKAVKVDPGGYGVSWDDDTDLSEYELWNNGIEIEPDMVHAKVKIAA